MTAGSGPFQALAGRVEQVLEDTRRVVQRAGYLLDKTRRTGDDGYMDGVALNLHSFYAGMEACFEDIARTVDGVIPEGANWHKDLLQQMAAMRPAVIGRSFCRTQQ